MNLFILVTLHGTKCKTRKLLKRVISIIVRKQLSVRIQWLEKTIGLLGFTLLHVLKRNDM